MCSWLPSTHIPRQLAPPWQKNFHRIRAMRRWLRLHTTHGQHAWFNERISSFLQLDFFIRRRGVKRERRPTTKKNGQTKGSNQKNSKHELFNYLQFFALKISIFHLFRSKAFQSVLSSSFVRLAEPWTWTIQSISSSNSTQPSSTFHLAGALYWSAWVELNRNGCYENHGARN